MVESDQQEIRIDPRFTFPSNRRMKLCLIVVATLQVLFQPGACQYDNDGGTAPIYAKPCA